MKKRSYWPTPITSLLDNHLGMKGTSRHYGALPSLAEVPSRHPSYKRLTSNVVIDLWLAGLSEDRDIRFIVPNGNDGSSSGALSDIDHLEPTVVLKPLINFLIENSRIRGTEDFDFHACSSFQLVRIIIGLILLLFWFYL